MSNRKHTLIGAMIQDITEIVSIKLMYSANVIYIVEIVNDIWQ